MTAPIFVDTAYLIALLDPRDSRNREAVGIAKSLAAKGVPLVSCDAVLLEFANYFARGPLRVHVIDWIESMRSGQDWEVVPVDRALLSRAEARYRVHADKNWSLTDCICMEIMTARRIRDIATTDGGFTQAGFRVLMRR